MKRWLKINNLDNVCVALDSLAAGEVLNIDGVEITLQEPIDNGHKFSIAMINEGEVVLKYGFPIGFALQQIIPGQLVHTHNIKTTLRDNLEYDYNPTFSQIMKPESGRTFEGYLRKNGEVGIRNELWIVPTVGCVNGQAQLIVDRAKRELEVAHIDDIVVFKHNYGCSQLGDDLENTQKALAALINHPNAGGVLVLGLGCENNQIANLKKFVGNVDDERVVYLSSQEVEDEVEVGLGIVAKLAEAMKTDSRSTLSVSHLKIGLKCGGSDGFSGITANPLLGRFSDWLVGLGGTTVLTEVPEMFGAETILMDRAKDSSVFQKTVGLINGFKDYFREHNQPIYENPSPGNKKGGITTLEEKSLGCVQKGGSATVVDVLSYAEPLKEAGLNLLYSPGNDLVASSALGFSGCQMVLFTTGRGTPFGSFVPTMKVATNSALAKHKSNWIDFNAGVLLEDIPAEEVTSRFIDYVISVASGQKLNHEKTGFKEIAIFKTGVTL